MKRKLLILVMALFTGALFGQSTFRTNVVVLKTAPMLHLNGSGAYINFFNGDLTLTQSANTLTLAGGNLALGANSLTLTGSIGATGARITKGWMTDLEITNSPTVNGIAISSIYAPLVSPTFTGTVSGITASMVGLGNVTNASKSTMFTDPTFTGTTTTAKFKVGSSVNSVVLDSITSTGANILFYNGATALNGGGGGGGVWGGITGTIGDQTDLGNALALKANLASPTFTGTVSGITKSMVGLANVTNESKATMFTAPAFTGTVTGITSAMVGLGSVTNESKATMFTNAAFTGTTTGITKAMVGLSNVTNESKTTMFTSPTFTGTVSGVTATHVGLGNVTNESKSTMFTSPTFTGTVVMSSPFSLGGVSVTTTGTRLNYVANVTSDIQAQLNDTISAKTYIPLLTDTVGLFTFGGGSGAAGDTVNFRTGRFYGTFFNASTDTLVVTSMMNVLQGTSASVAVDVCWNATLGSASATHLNTTPPTVTSVTTGDEDTSFNNSKIPPRVFVWCKLTTVSVQPTYFSCTISGYKINKY